VDFSARTVITGDPSLELDQVGVPTSMAMRLTMPVCVTSLNIDEMQRAVMKGPDELGGALYVLRKDGERFDLMYAGSLAKVAARLQVGDTVERMLRDGDWVVMNRQPSLHKNSMMGHRAKILPYSTFRLNLSVTGPYNADFDGDVSVKSAPQNPLIVLTPSSTLQEMNLHVPQSIPACVEVETLMSVGANILSGAANKPTMGIVQDALLACHLLSGGCGPVFIDRSIFFDLMMVADCAAVSHPAVLAPTPLWTGTQVLDLAWPADFHYHRKDVRIVDGVLIEGVLSKKTLGPVHGGIIHVMHHSHGAATTMAFMNKVQNVANHWLQHHGFSVGIADCCPELADEVDICNKITHHIHKNAVHAKSVADEATIYGNLNRTRDIAAYDYLRRLDNNLTAMMNAGSKGSKINVAQISACVGQQSVNGKRIAYSGAGRTTSHYARHTNDPIGRGFVANNYLNGLRPAEFFMHAAGGRVGLIDTAVKTSEVGQVSVATPVFWRLSRD